MRVDAAQLVIGAILAVSTTHVPAHPRLSAAAGPTACASRGVDTVTRPQGFRVVVVPALLDLTPDSVTLSYVVTVVPTARDSLTSFMVDAPAVLHVRVPNAWSGAWSSTSWHERVTAGWGVDSAFLGPGSSTPPLVYSARGVVDIVRYWAEADEPPNTVDTVLASDSIPTPPSADTAVTLYGTTGFTVGVGPMPVDRSPAGLASRLANLITRACRLGWVDDPAVCDSLRAKVRPDAASLAALLRELGAQRGRHVSEAAFVLVSANANMLLGRL